MVTINNKIMLFLTPINNNVSLAYSKCYISIHKLLQDDIMVNISSWLRRNAKRPSYNFDSWSTPSAETQRSLPQVGTAGYPTSTGRSYFGPLIQYRARRKKHGNYFITETSEIFRKSTKKTNATVSSSDVCKEEKKQQFVIQTGHEP